MRDTRFENRSSEWMGDMTVWLRANAGDNSEQMARLRRNLRRAREQELTNASGRWWRCTTTRE